jgi:hypothetical protein
MSSSAEIALLFKIAQLAERYGLKPSEANTYIELIPTFNGGIAAFQLSFSGCPREKQTQLDKFEQSLGCDDNRRLATAELGEMEDIVERALALAPRARTR